MVMPNEPDFPPGHPARFDFTPGSPEAQEWARTHIFPKGERDFPPGHPKAVDTEGNQNSVAILPGVNPAKPDLEPFTGRTPEQAKAARELYQQVAAQVPETPAPEPTTAPPPPKEQGAALPAGQPGGV